MSHNGLSRRRFLQLSGATGAALTLAACVPSAPGDDMAGPAAEARVVSHYAQGLTPRERLETDRWDPPQALWALEEAYKDLHPDVDLEFIESVASGYDEWMVTQLTAGTAPEILWYQRGWIARDYEKN